MKLDFELRNATTYTPYLTAIDDAGGDWDATRALTVGQSIPGNGTITGRLLIPDTRHETYQGYLTLRYSFVVPGPNGADVTLKFTVKNADYGSVVGEWASVVPVTPGLRVEVTKSGAAKTGWALALTVASTLLTGTAPLATPSTAAG